jgi:cytochrome P450 family 110
MLPPGSRLPPFLQMLRWMRDPAGTLVRDARHYGDAYTVRSLVFGTQVVFNEPGALKQIFTGDPETFLAGEANRPLGIILGRQSIMLLDGAEHLHVRRMMMPAFHGERMRHYTEAMRGATLRAVATLRPGDRVALHGIFHRIALDIILLTVLGLEEGPELERVRAQMTHLLARILAPSGSVWLLPFTRRDLGRLTPWASLKREIDEANRMLRDHIAQHRASASTKNDVLSALMAATDEHGTRLDDASLCDQLMTLLIAGHETTATTLSWAFEELLRVPGEQERLAAEVQEVTAGAPLATEHLPRLERIDSALKEALRLHPVTGAVARILKTPATIGGHALPAGISLVAAFHATHRRPDLYPDPDRFVPDRFVGKKLDPYEWAPFGGGIHRCLGMAFSLHEMKVIMASLPGAGIRVRLEARGPVKTVLRSLLNAPGAARGSSSRPHDRSRAAPQRSTRIWLTLSNVTRSAWGELRHTRIDICRPQARVSPFSGADPWDDSGRGATQPHRGAARLGPAATRGTRPDFPCDP